MTAPATFHKTCTSCPTQAEGRTTEGRPWYFRARHGQWELHLGKLDWPLDRLEWPNDEPEDWKATIIAEGDDPTHGEMPDKDVVAILREYLP